MVRKKATEQATAAATTTTEATTKLDCAERPQHWKNLLCKRRDRNKTVGFPQTPVELGRAERPVHRNDVL